MLVLGVDSSTTATKAIAWDASGKAVAEGRRPHSLDHPAPDAWEQDSEDWWQATVGALADCARELGPRAREVLALCVAHQRETFVLVDPAGRPLTRAVVWMDSRGAEHVARAAERVGAERLHAITGKPPCITPSLYKLLALFDREPALQSERPSVLDVHAFLVSRLTGRRATSLASADPLGLVDMRARAWSTEILELCGLDRSELPELVEPGSVVGSLREEVANVTGFAAGLPVVAGAGDGQAAGLGAGIVGAGCAYLNLGTAIVSGVLSREYSIDRAFRTLFGAAPGTYFLETDLKGGTFTLSWLVEKWASPGADPSAMLSELESRATGFGPGSDGLMVVPYWNGVMNPYWDDRARGITVGWSGHHGPAHLYRAILEGIAFEQRLHTTGVEAATGAPIREMIVMGGGSRSPLWCQILSDVLDKPVVRARSAEATALGAAILASAAARVHPDLPAAVAQMTDSAEKFVPGPDRRIYDELYREVYVGLFPALRGSLSRLGVIAR